MKLNKKGFENAKKLIEKGEWKQTQEWEPPTPEEENEYIEKNGFEEYGKWFLGIREDTDPETKQHFAYPFTDDFKKVNRKGIIAIRQRAGQQGHEEIFEAAGKLLEQIDAQTEKRIIAYREKKYEKGSEGIYSFLITSENRDRMGDILQVNGMRYENFMKNPIVLWNHDASSLPIGKVESLQIEDRRIIANIKFSETNDVAVKVKGLIDEGILNAVSVGFLPLKSEPIVEDNIVRGYKYIEWELLEVSVVNIPANPTTLLIKYMGLEKKEEKNIHSVSDKPSFGEEVVLRKLCELNEKYK